MLAVSRERTKLFLYEPDDGRAVPVVVDLLAASCDIAVPSPVELEEEYFACDDWAAALLEIDEARRSSAEMGRRMSEEFSVRFREEIADGAVTVAALRRMALREKTTEAAEPMAVEPMPAERAYAPPAQGTFTAD